MAKMVSRRVLLLMIAMSFVASLPGADNEILIAEINVAFKPSHQPKAILVLSPGQNGSGEEFLRDPLWLKFAETRDLVVLVPHFVSRDDALRAGRGYFVAARGSGSILLDFVDTHGWAKIPILLYGFSGGAHFAMSFAAWAPERVLGFCAYSFAWWTPPPDDLRCPALIACGQFDGARFGSSFAYFQAGRRQGKPWTWVSLEDQGHSRNLKFEEFVMTYFAGILSSPPSSTVAVDNVSETIRREGSANDLTTSILPNSLLLSEWQAIHHP